MSELGENHEGEEGEVLITEAEAEEQAGEVKKSKEKVLKESSLTGVFSTPEQNDPLKMLFTPGAIPMNLLMRGNHKDRAMVVAGAHIMSQCKEFNDKTSAEECMMVMAGTCGIGADRAKMLVDAYIGKENGKQRRGIGEWIREKAGFGTDDKGSQ